MLFVHEYHWVKGRQELEFEAAFRDLWMPMLGKDDDARLLYYCHHTHGTGPAYGVLTLTAVKDGAAWERLVTRMQRGDLAQHVADLDEMRHRVEQKTLIPVPWIPLQEVDFGTVPTTPQDHAPSIFMEDTGWPHAPLADYIRFWDEGYYQPMEKRPREDRLLDIQMVFQPAYGAGRRKEAILWQKVLDHDRLLGLLLHETDPELLKPGAFMSEALTYRDTWESRLLRTAPWSPLF